MHYFLIMTLSKVASVPAHVSNADAIGRVRADA